MLYIQLQVGFINFSSYYNDYTNPLRVDVNDVAGIFYVTTPEDILTNNRCLNIELPVPVVSITSLCLCVCTLLHAREFGKSCQ